VAGSDWLIIFLFNYFMLIFLYILHQLYIYVNTWPPRKVNSITKVSLSCRNHQKMMQRELPQPSWPFYSVIDSTFEQVEDHDLNMEFSPVDGYDLSSLFTTTEDSSELCQIPCSSAMFLDDFLPYPPFDDSQQQVMLAMKDFSMGLEGLDYSIWDNEIQGTYGLFGESEGSFPLPLVSTEGEDFLSHSPSMNSESSTDVASIQPSLIFPGEDMEIDNQLRVHHLLQAYEEALENEQRELAEVILRSIGEKVSPVGETFERVAFYLSQDIGNQGDYLKQESCKNFEAAFMAFYQTFPEGRFAHFAANSAILEAMPDDEEMIHIVDFDMGEGVQWPAMIEAISSQHKTLKLTSIKWEEEDSNYVPSPWRFEETKRRLYDQARSSGLKLTVEEMGIENLVSEMKKMKKRGGRREWLVFNCMVGLPHMGRGRSRKLVMQFLRVAKELIAGNRGIITFGDGDGCEKLKNCSAFGSFFDGHLVHYQALLESLEVNFSHHLAEARVAMECLFVAPYISSLAWFQKWEEIREGCHLQAALGLEGRRLSKEILTEAKEMVREGENSYGARIQGQIGNEMVLKWKATSIVRVSVWTNQI